MKELIIRKILIVGGGGREHTIAWKIHSDNPETVIFMAPGNGGTASFCTNTGIKSTDIEGVLDICRKENFDLVVVAQDDPLALGMVDRLKEKGITAFGPVQGAAKIESSKIFSKNLMKKYGIPTAEYEVFTDAEKALEYIKGRDCPIVVKADGLALGKGVVIAQSEKEAIDAIMSMMKDEAFGKSGKNIVIEDFLTGPEVTVLAFADGKTVLPMVSSQDHKRIFDNDEGPNTGGMGTIAPAPVYDKNMEDICLKKIINPTIQALKSEGIIFKGIIYFGLMLTPKGPYVIEYNARFGDPEAQVVLPLLENNLLDVFMACIKGELENIFLKFKAKAAACVIMASGGYPSSYKTGYEIKGLENAEKNALIFHAGTKAENSKIYTNGGRVLGVTCMGDDLGQALDKAYNAVNLISFKDMHYRKDIGKGTRSV